MVSAGLPLYHPSDVNRDDRMDLKDVILQVQNFSDSAERPAAFQSSLRDVITTLYIVSGLKKVIKTDRSACPGGSPSLLDQPGLVALFSQNPQKDFGTILTEGAQFYRSIDPTPLTPPPRYAA